MILVFVDRYEEFGEQIYVERRWRANLAVWMCEKEIEIESLTEINIIVFRDY